MPLSKDVPGIEKPYVLTAEMLEQREDAIKIIDTILRITEISEEMKKKVIDYMLWNISGAGEGTYGKYLIRYRSTKSISNKNERIIHEHVFQRKHLKNLIVKEHFLTDELADNIVSCVVTEEEHKELQKAGKGLVGWNRYIAAKIEVQDMKKMCIYEFPISLL